MKTALIAVAFLVLGLGWTSDAVKVQEGGMSFSLEAVQRLQELTDQMLATKQNPHIRPSAFLCLDPLLPQEFVPLCRQKGGSESLARLALVPMDVCEICSFAACTGC
ncbi:unnamed protein product [Knipowitschia caucasica]|uniref:Guanylate cyclase activator 2B n=1 Tax=Knipowitschia caucasica TaxID=637954 RepID=A0AAV2JD02_KNICA